MNSAESHTKLDVKYVYVQDPGLWPVSPVKLGQPSASGPSILEVEFNDEEDDEDDEYKPSKDAEVFLQVESIWERGCVLGAVLASTCL